MKAHTTTTFLTVMATTIIFFSTGVSADISWTQTDTVTDEEGTQSFEQTISLTGGKFAIAAGDGSFRMIIDIETGIITSINGASKTYTVSSLANLEAMRDKIENETEAIIEQALKNIPDAQKETYRKELEKQLTEAKEQPEEPGVTEYKPTGKSAKIGSWNAKQFRAENTDGSHYDVWCAKEIDTKELRDFFDKAGDSRFMKDVSSGLETLTFGFPVKSVITDENGTTESVVTSVSYKKLPQEVFGIPEGYTEAPTGME